MSRRQELGVGQSSGEVAARDSCRPLIAAIHPSVLAATPEELIAAGWGEVPRHLIPADWRMSVPRIWQRKHIPASRLSEHAAKMRERTRRRTS